MQPAEQNSKIAVLTFELKKLSSKEYIAPPTTLNVMTSDDNPTAWFTFNERAYYPLGIVKGSAVHGAICKKDKRRINGAKMKLTFEMLDSGYEPAEVIANEYSKDGYYWFMAIMAHVEGTARLTFTIIDRPDVSPLSIDITMKLRRQPKAAATSTDVPGPPIPVELDLDEFDLDFVDEENEEGEENAVNERRSFSRTALSSKKRRNEAIPDPLVSSSRKQARTTFFSSSTASDDPLLRSRGRSNHQQQEENDELDSIDTMDVDKSQAGGEEEEVVEGKKKKKREDKKETTDRRRDRGKEREPVSKAVSEEVSEEWAARQRKLEERRIRDRARRAAQRQLHAASASSTTATTPQRSNERQMAQTRGQLIKDVDNTVRVKKEKQQEKVDELDQSEEEREEVEEGEGVDKAMLQRAKHYFENQLSRVPQMVPLPLKYRLEPPEFNLTIPLPSPVMQLSLPGSLAAALQHDRSVVTPLSVVLVRSYGLADSDGVGDIKQIKALLNARSWFSRANSPTVAELLTKVEQRCMSQANAKSTIEHLRVLFEQCFEQHILYADEQVVLLPLIKHLEQEQRLMASTFGPHYFLRFLVYVAAAAGYPKGESASATGRIKGTLFDTERVLEEGIKLMEYYGINFLP